MLSLLSRQSRLHPSTMARDLLLRQAINFLFTLFALIVLFRSSNALPTENLKLAEYTHLEERQHHRRPPRGVHVVQGTCTGLDLLTINTAILNATDLAGAGLNAAADFNRLPFSYFFKDDIATANSVAGVLGRIQSSLQGGGTSIGITCDDQFKGCGKAPITHPAYTAQDPTRPDSVPVINFCPTGLRLGRNPKPCSANPGAISLGWLLVHAMAPIYSISGDVGRINDLSDMKLDNVNDASARNIHKLLGDGFDTRKVSTAYAHVCSWSYDMGLGDKKEVCLQNFWRGQFYTKGMESIDASPAPGTYSGFPSYWTFCDPAKEDHCYGKDERIAHTAFFYAKWIVCSSRRLFVYLEKTQNCKWIKDGSAPDVWDHNGVHKLSRSFGPFPYSKRHQIWDAATDLFLCYFAGHGGFMRASFLTGCHAGFWCRPSASILLCLCILYPRLILEWANSRHSEFHS